MTSPLAYTTMEQILKYWLNLLRYLELDMHCVMYELRDSDRWYRYQCSAPGLHIWAACILSVLYLNIPESEMTVKNYVIHH